MTAGLFPLAGVVRRSPRRTTPAPFDAAPKVRRTLRVEVGRRTCWLYGDEETGRAVRGLIERVGAPCMWDHTRRCWMVSVNRADDVIAAAEHWQRRHVDVVAVDR